MSLIEHLVSTIGLTQQQAEGAVGAVGRLAQGKLSSELFSELGRLVPGLSAMIGAAPKPSGMASMLGEKAGLASVLSQLGIDLGKAGPIVQLVTTFIQSQGSAGLQAALAKMVR